MATTPSVQEKKSPLIFQLSLIFWVAQILVIFSTWRYLPPQLPLFYSRPWGEEQLTNPLGILVLPGLSIIIILGNLLITSVLPQEEILMKQILRATSLVFNFFCLITLIQILRIII